MLPKGPPNRCHRVGSSKFRDEIGARSIHCISLRSPPLSRLRSPKLVSIQPRPKNIDQTSAKTRLARLWFHKRLKYSLEPIQRLLRSSEILGSFVVDEPEASRLIGLAVAHDDPLRSFRLASYAKVCFTKPQVTGWRTEWATLPWVAATSLKRSLVVSSERLLCLKS
jgi:hypothetical protein